MDLKFPELNGSHPGHRVPSTVLRVEEQLEQNGDKQESSESFQNCFLGRFFTFPIHYHHHHHLGEHLCKECDRPCARILGEKSSGAKQRGRLAHYFVTVTSEELLAGTIW